jgi:hypothetical protein
MEPRVRKKKHLERILVVIFFSEGLLVLAPQKKIFIFVVTNKHLERILLVGFFF